MEEGTTDEAVRILIAFIREMHQWQQMCTKLYKKVVRGYVSWEQLDAEAWKELRRIFSEYVEYKELPENLVFSQSYFPEAENIVEVRRGKRRIMVVADRTKFTPQTRVRYILTKV